MDDRYRALAQRALEAAAALTAVGVVIAVIMSGARWPSLVTLAVFGVLLFVAENTSVQLPSSTSVSPGFMLIMAAIAALAGRSGDDWGVVGGVSLVGFCGGVILEPLREGRYGTVVYNASLHLLAGAAAASVYVLNGSPSGSGVYLWAVPAAVAHVVVNVALVVPWAALKHRATARAVWAQLRPAVPGSLAFGLLGVLVGQLFTSLGPLVLPLLLTPAVIARSAFAAYLELHKAHDAAVRVFVRAIEAKDRYTAGHCERVARYADYMGRELGLASSQLEHLHYAALMHDVGKLTVPTRLLNKPGKLTEEEFAQVRRHNDVCIAILTRVDFMKAMVPVASDRHGHFSRSDSSDGTAMAGYIVAVADAFDAMTSTRSYRRALSQEVAFAELRDKAGTQFHPDCVEALITVIERRGERYGLGHEEDIVEFDVPPPVVGVGSAGLGDVLANTEVARA